MNKVLGQQLDLKERMDENRQRLLDLKRRLEESDKGKDN